MGNQGSSGDDTRNVETWIQAGVIGDVHTVMCGPTALFGRREFLHQRENLIFRKNWIGIFGLELRPIVILIQCIFLPPGGLGDFGTGSLG